jgi:hypothetical protein
MSTVSSTERPAQPRIGTAAWGRIRGGRLAPGERLRFVLGTVAVQFLRLLRAAVPDEGEFRRRRARVDLERIELPDTRAVAQALDLVQRSTPDWLCRHTLRTWSWAVLLSQAGNLEPDREVLAMSCLLHDLALMPMNGAEARARCSCFAIEGGHRAALFLAERGWDRTRTRAVEEAICLHMNPRVAVREGLEAHLLHEAAALDVVGARFADVGAPSRKKVLDRYPRTGFEQEMAAAMAAQAGNCSTTRTATLWRLGLERAIRRSAWTR